MGAKAGKLSSKQLKHFSEQGRTSIEDLKRLQESYNVRFGSLEAEKSEMIQLYARLHPDDGKNPILKHIMRQLENPKTGKVSFEHFISAISTISGGTLDERIEFSFALFDIDGDGQIDKFEMLEIVRTAYRLQKDTDGLTPEERIRQTFYATDVNDDGVLIKSEFIQAVKLNSDVCDVICKAIGKILSEMKDEILKSHGKGTGNGNGCPK